MYQITYNYVESRVQELRHYSQPRAAYGRQVVPTDLGNQVRKSAGEAFIALGNWLKSGSHNENLTPARLGGS